MSQFESAPEAAADHAAAFQLGCKQGCDPRVTRGSSRFTRRAGIMDPSVFNRGIERPGGTLHTTGTAARGPSTGRRRG